jgi:hypothetical protein
MHKDRSRHRTVGRLSLLAATVAAVAVLAGGPVSAPWQVGSAQAYSYAAAGKEPLLDAREAALTAIGDGDWAAVQTALDGAEAELTYLREHHFPQLNAHLQAAIASKDEAAFRAALREAFSAEIERRLDGAKQNLDAFQTSKVLVIKARRFLDAIAGDLPADARSQAEQGLNAALAAIGNPGVFGVGAKPANPEAFAKAEATVNAALAP